jgi:short-subunit dehydrogenase
MPGANLTAVVTGASSGIGRALAVALARQGVRVGAVARRADLLAQLAEEVRAAGGTIETAVADVGDRAGLAAAIQGLERVLGPTDLLIANAGVGGDTGAVEMNVPVVERVLRVNFLGVVYAIESVLPGMIARRSGHVVGISSIAAFKGLPGAAAYCASKSAVNAYLEGLRIELRAHGVAVTAVCPGFVRTPMVAKNPPMPFLMEPDAAAARILRALRRKPAVYAFPWPMKLLIRFARWAPDWFVAHRVKMKLDVGG